VISQFGLTVSCLFKKEHHSGTQTSAAVDVMLHVLYSYRLSLIFFVNVNYRTPLQECRLYRPMRMVVVSGCYKMIKMGVCCDLWAGGHRRDFVSWGWRI